MGFKSALRKFLREKMTVNGLAYEFSLETYFEIFNKSALSGKKSVVYLDAASSLYSIQLDQTGEAMKLNDLAWRYIKFIQDILHTENAETFVFMFDRETPLAKYVNPKTVAEPTPLDTDDNHHAVWAKYFERYVEGKNLSNLEYMLNYIATPKDRNPTPFDYVLPPEKWLRLLGNRAYKEYVTWLLCNSIFHFSQIPENKTLIVIGPNGFAKKRQGSQLLDRDEALVFDFYEADFAVTYLEKMFPGYDKVYFSIDGDVMLNLLYNHSPKQDTDDKVYVVSTFSLTQQQCAFVDIHRLWMNVRMYIQRIKNGKTMKNPVATFCTLCMLCGNDYVNSFPQIGPVNMFKGFEITINSGVVDFIKNPFSRKAKVLNAKSYFLLILNCYASAFKSLDFPLSPNYASYTEAITKALKTKKGQPVLTLEIVRNTLANLNWTLEYMIYSSRGERPPSPTARSTSGLSLYGYDSDCVLNETATYKVWRPDNTTLELLAKPF